MVSIAAFTERTFDFESDSDEDENLESLPKCCDEIEKKSPSLCFCISNLYCSAFVFVRITVFAIVFVFKFAIVFKIEFVFIFEFGLYLT